MYDPAVESAEELSDVGTLVVIAPSPNYRVEVRDQFQSIQWHASPSSLTHLIHEALDRLFLREKRLWKSRKAKSRFPTFPQPRLLRNTLSYGIRIQGASPLCHRMRGVGSFKISMRGGRQGPPLRGVVSEKRFLDAEDGKACGALAAAVSASC